MTFFESERIKKAGCDAGWTIVESETSDALVLGSFAHSSQATVQCLELFLPLPPRHRTRRVWRIPHPAPNPRRLG